MKLATTPARFAKLRLMRVEMYCRKWKLATEVRQ